MNILGTVFGFIWHEILFRPIFNLLAFFYQSIALKDFGIALIFATFVIKFLTFSINVSQRKNQVLTQKLQVEIAEIRKRFGHNKEIVAKKITELYKKNKINPFGSCLTIIIQLFIFTALWRVISNSLGKDFDQNLLYPFLKNFGDWPKELNQNFLGEFDLRKASSSSIVGIVFVIVSAILQYIQVDRFSPQVKKPDKDATEQERISYEMAKQSKFMAPLFSFMFIGLPLGLTLYSATGSAITLLQTAIIHKFYKHEEVDSLKTEEKSGAKEIIEEKEVKKIASAKKLKKKFKKK